jgi:mono/diheme cytochrome c family protein
MLRAVTSLVFVVFTVAFVAASSRHQTAAGQAKGWTLPPTAKEEKNPVPVNDATLAAGKKLFLQKCQRCHGPEAKGDGPDANHDHHDHMDLTNPKNAANNPDGVVFYKVWHGRQNPRMPAFEDQLTKEQAWAIVAYTQTLRKK